MFFLKRKEHLTVLGLSAFLVVLAPLGIDLSWSAMQDISVYFSGNSRYTLTAYFFGLALGQLCLGVAADKFGRRPMILGSLILYSMAAWLISVCTSIEAFVVLRSLQGFAGGGLIIAWMMVIQDTFPQNQVASRYSLLNAILNTVPVLGPWLGHFLVTYGSWSTSFQFMGAFSAILVVIFYQKLPETKRSDVNRLNWKQLSHLFRQPNFLKYSYCCCAAHAFILSYVALAPGILMDTYHLSLANSTTFFSINAFVVMVVCYLTPYLIQRFDEHRVFFSGLFLMLLGGFGLCLTAVWSSVWIFFASVHIACLGFGIFLGPTKAFALRSETHAKGTAAAFLGFFDLISAFVLSTAMTYMAATALHLGLFLVLAMLLGFLMLQREFQSLSGWQKRPL